MIGGMSPNTQWSIKWMGMSWKTRSLFAQPVDLAIRWAKFIKNAIWSLMRLSRDALMALKLSLSLKLAKNGWISLKYIPPFWPKVSSTTPRQKHSQLKFYPKSINLHRPLNSKSVSKISLRLWPRDSGKLQGNLFLLQTILRLSSKDKNSLPSKS